MFPMHKIQLYFLGCYSLSRYVCAYHTYRCPFIHISRLNAISGYFPLELQFSCPAFFSNISRRVIYRKSLISIARKSEARSDIRFSIFIAPVWRNSYNNATVSIKRSFSLARGFAHMHENGGGYGACKNAPNPPPHVNCMPCNFARRPCNLLYAQYRPVVTSLDGVHTVITSRVRCTHACTSPSGG